MAYVDTHTISTSPIVDYRCFVNYPLVHIVIEPVEKACLLTLGTATVCIQSGRW